MSREGRELAGLIRGLLAPAGSGRDDGPSWLAGAEVRANLDDPTPRLEINCPDPAALKKLDETIRDLAEKAVAGHDAHIGAFSTCGDEICALMRDALIRMGGEIYLPDDGPVN